MKPVAKSLVVLILAALCSMGCASQLANENAMLRAQLAAQQGQAGLNAGGPMGMGPMMPLGNSVLGDSLPPLPSAAWEFRSDRPWAGCDKSSRFYLEISNQTGGMERMRLWVNDQPVAILNAGGVEPMLPKNGRLYGCIPAGAESLTVSGELYELAGPTRAFSYQADVSASRGLNHVYIGEREVALNPAPIRR
ncbi:MAG: hypothetical protein PHT12_02735 [Patescibacteria group bacterium]|nr:hypothetical protein [Patescibacteria group bacterium]